MCWLWAANLVWMWSGIICPTIIISCLGYPHLFGQYLSEGRSLILWPATDVTCRSLMPVLPPPVAATVKDLCMGMAEENFMPGPPSVSADRWPFCWHGRTILSEMAVAFSSWAVKAVNCQPSNRVVCRVFRHICHLLDIGLGNTD